MARTTFAVVAVLGAVSLVCGCEEEKKAPATAPSASAAAPPASTAAAPAAPKPKPEELSSRTIKAAVVAWNAHDAAKVAANYEPTARLVIAGLPEMSGKDAIAANAKDNFTAYPDFKVAVTRSFAKGNTAVFEWTITGKNDGPSMGKPATGRQMGVTGVGVATFDDDGLIKEEHRYLDLPTIQSQLDPKAKAGTFRAPVALPTGPTEEHVSKGTPDEAKTIEQGDAIIKADESKDEKALMATVSADYVWQDNTSATTITPANLKTAQGAYNTAFPDWTMPHKLTIAADGYYVIEATFTGTQKGPMGPVKATNKPVKVGMVDIQLIKDGKATKEWSYFNSADLLIQLGAMPPMVPPVPAGSAVAATTPTVAKPK
jgi:steroid delta-isomerase-like uncharacterized protein